MYSEALPIVREAIEFRYRLIPYLYTLFFDAARTGQPIMRPLVYHFPNDARCHSESFDFLLGPNLLVASVLEPGARTRSVYLPGTGEWYDFYTGACYRGGQTIVADAPLERIPLFVPAGGIIPMGKVLRHANSGADDVRHAYAFPDSGQGRGTFVLVEDDGCSNDYQYGGYSEILLETAAEADQIMLRAQPLHIGYPLPYTKVEFILPPGESRQLATKTGGEIEPTEDGRRRIVVPLLRPAPEADQAAARCHGK
jgi:alpha-glucosidase